MAKKEISKGASHDQHEHELLENPEAIRESLGKGEAFLKKNSRIVGGLIIAAIVIIAGVLFFQFNNANKDKQAQADMFQAVYYFEQDSLSLAMEGDGVNEGFLEIIEEYSGTNSANLAHYYTGAIYLAEGEYQKAVDHLRKFSADDFFVQAKAFSLLGDAHMELGETSEAIRAYEKAVDYKENKFFTPMYLNKLAIAFEKAGELDNAIEAYDIIEKKYPESYEFTFARKHKARLEGLASK
ncbi:hypothetical protein GCM10007049_09130 [Echinicola pacifica]|uniref:Ancillary SecYEG translocon subunit/Cell division coordinator CpoB TPR domain-containing protein n=1 Tax=Echinicola pacifica TaxID=346377 RepID=A0A918PQ53_9BACT|nr:tetratricopeptide repeat protein [Echinicola pacifica]GGZ19007.1 hypothetical protein GCM10007049_09130 [Echinicola pacifica]